MFEESSHAEEIKARKFNQDADSEQSSPKPFLSINGCGSRNDPDNNDKSNIQTPQTYIDISHEFLCREHERYRFLTSNQPIKSLKDETCKQSSCQRVYDTQPPSIQENTFFAPELDRSVTDATTICQLKPLESTKGVEPRTHEYKTFLLKKVKRKVPILKCNEVKQNTRFSEDKMFELYYERLALHVKKGKQNRPASFTEKSTYSMDMKISHQESDMNAECDDFDEEKSPSTPDLWSNSDNGQTEWKTGSYDDPSGQAPYFYDPCDFNPYIYRHQLQKESKQIASESSTLKSDLDEQYSGACSHDFMIVEFPTSENLNVLAEKCGPGNEVTDAGIEQASLPLYQKNTSKETLTGCEGYLANLESKQDLGASNHPRAREQCSSENKEKVAILHPLEDKTNVVSQSRRNHSIERDESSIKVKGSTPTPTPIISTRNRD